MNAALGPVPRDSLSVVPSMLSLPVLLTFGMLALLSGATIGWMMQRRGWGLAALKGLMASFIGGMLLLHLLPEAYHKAGPIALLFVALGFLFMILPERFSHHKEHKPPGRFFTAEMLWIGLFLHQATDGMGLALASSGAMASWQLALVVISHNVPVAAVVFWMFLRNGTLKQAWLRIAAMGAATLVGALFSQALEPLLSGNSINLFFAFITGSFLHLMFHDFLDHHAHLDRDRRAEFLAFSIGIALLVGLEHFVGGSTEAAGHVHGETTGFAQAFLLLARETSPYLLVGLVISGLLHAYMPASPIAWLKRGGHLGQSVKGMLFGLPLPICSCGVLPLFLGLARKGVPSACVIAFLIATPELGVDSFLLSVKLLGVKFSMVRLLVAMVLPIAIALVVVRFLPAPIVAEAPKSCCKHKHPEPAGEDHHGHTHGPAPAEDAPKPWWHFAFVSLVDDIFPFVFFGLFVAAVAQTIWPEGQLSQLVGQWDVVILALIGIPFYVCASASVPFALVLLQHGFSVGAVVVFLFAGPATNVATVLTVDKAFGKGAGLKLAGTALILAMVMGFLINAVYTPESLGILELHDHGWSLLDRLAFAVIAVLCLASLYRSGPLHWISNVMSIVPGLIHHPRNGESPH